MKRIRLILLAVLAVNVTVAMVASAKGLLPSMVYRRGLTNEQIDWILSVHPDAQLRMTAQDWRAIKYQLCRFDCMTNYVEMIGSTQDCARVLLSLHDTIESKIAANAALRRELHTASNIIDIASIRLVEWQSAYADTTNSLAAVTADYMSASNRAARAEARTSAVIAWAEEQRDKAVMPTTKALWQQFIDRLMKQED